jgi:methylenetetrahydrofolate reductase (NADPH)
MQRTPDELREQFSERSGRGNPPKISFEFFPPKTEKAAGTLWKSVDRLKTLSPHFVSVTYGADGSTRERTHDAVVRMKNETGLITMPHLTCIGAKRTDIDEIADEYWELGIRHIMALRGDPPTGAGTEYRPHPGGYAYAADLVEGLRKRHDFTLGVGAYPETHPDAPDAESDLDNLKRKFDAGATMAVTQFFFSSDKFLRFRDRCVSAGIDQPIIPGILPIINFATAQKLSTACGTHIPDWMIDAFDGLDEDAETRKLIAASIAIEQVLALQAEGVAEFHFYTLNRADLCFAVAHALGARPNSEALH